MTTKQSFQWTSMTMGVCYYPEHWDRGLWQSDLRRMKDAGISTVRVAEFAWSKVEPEEGRFTYEFFDGFLDLCEREGMQVIFGTPTATPPAWLTEKYPEVLNAREDGVLYRHGGRRHYNYNSPKYQELSARIVEKLAQHYGKHPAIVGWQIDNELNCEVCEFHSDADSVAFRAFLQEKYGTLDRLNEAWGTVFWNQTYTDWQQVFVPRTLLNDGYNPHLRLDYYRFISESTIRFCRMQADILRKYKKPGDFVTTNGIFWNLDNHRMQKECLDVFTYDSYPCFAFGLDRGPIAPDDLNDRGATLKLIEVRSVCLHFGIMEQQSGANGWATRMESPAPRPGQLTLWAMQSVAQGADYISFFRWRTCTFGTEIYWHGILDYDNRDNRKLAEVKDFYKKLKTLDPVCGAKFTAAFGLLKDYDNAWDTNLDSWHKRVADVSEQAIFETAERTHTPFDMVYLREDMTPEELSAYPLLIYPHPAIVTGQRAALLRAYVEQGGTLVIGCRSGYKQENAKCVMLPQPGLLQELTGSDVRDFTFTSGAEPPVRAVWGDREFEMPVFNDIMEVTEDAAYDAQVRAAAEGDATEHNAGAARVLATYKNSYYAGRAALIEKRTGRGKTLHLGSAFSKEIVELLLDYAGVKEPFADLIEAPQEVQVVQRCKDGRRWLFVLNYQPTPQRIILKRQATLLYDGGQYAGEVVLEPFGTAVYEM